MKVKVFNVELIVGLEFRGFFFGLSIVLKFNCGFVLVWKKGKLFGEKESVLYVLEYGMVKLNILYFDNGICICIFEK